MLNYLYKAIYFIVYIGVPLFFFIRLWKNDHPNLWSWLLEATLTGVYIANISLIGIWPMTYGFYVRNLLIILFFFIAVKSFLNTKRTFYMKMLNIKQATYGVVVLSIIGVLMSDIIQATEGSFLPSMQHVDLEFPLRDGEFCVVQGGASEVINHHFNIPAQKYAIDIVKLNALGLTSNHKNPKEVEDFNIYGSTIYSPCDGTVTLIEDDHIDQKPMEMDPEHPAGNYLALAMKNSHAILILAHIKKGSFKIKKGDLILKGQELAEVGNSGNTSEPHLHIHAVLDHTGDYLFTGEGIPMTFEGRFLVRNDRILMERSDAVD